MRISRLLFKNESIWDIEQSFDVLRKLGEWEKVSLAQKKTEG